MSASSLVANSLVAFAHFIAAFGLVATVFFEWFTFSRAPTVQEARRLVVADRLYGGFAAVLLVAGFARALWFEKGWAFYKGSPFFHVKLTLFVVMGLLSIYPTIQFIRWAPALRAGGAPVVTDRQFAIISRSLALQLVAAVGVLLSASLMAHGVGAR